MITFPKQLTDLLEENEFQAPLRTLADRVGEIVADNKLVFFPDYTDHGTDHINRVLRSEVELVPEQVWERCKKGSDRPLLCHADAAVIIGATLLHDIAMHLTPKGLLELVSENSRFTPLPWFKEEHEDHSADRPWHELWEEYASKARRFGARDLTKIIGEEAAKTWTFETLPEKIGQWENNHHLIIGEFIRRHHARLAHEIAIYGFPGLPIGSGEPEFPALGQEGNPLSRLADLIGLTARSHGLSLRLCMSYLDSNYPRSPRPMGAAVLYPMVLLRVADYLQIDRKRAPAVLLQLRDPQSPASVQAWANHLAVDHVGAAADPRGKMVVVNKDLSLPTYLQLRQLLTNLQTELDHSSAVLDEAYGTRADVGLDQLTLAVRRIHSNMDSPAFLRQLPYVPEETGFTSDPHLLSLLVEPLYGKEPSVGVRELIQNSVDAVRELKEWRDRGKPVISHQEVKQEADVLVEFIKNVDAEAKGRWILRVQDKGIGMESETIKNYFLRAGASFRWSPEWAKDFLNQDGMPSVARAGRFGIGAFAIFLLGPSFRLSTRHAGADESGGYTLDVSINSHLIEIRRKPGLPVGTTIEIDLSADTVEALCLDANEPCTLSEHENKAWCPRTECHIADCCRRDYGTPLIGERAHKLDWYCWDSPRVVIMIKNQDEVVILNQKSTQPIPAATPPLGWFVFQPKGFDAVYWSYEESPRLICNGIRIGHPTDRKPDEVFEWPRSFELRSPNLSVVDSTANLPLAVHRYRLSNKKLPFAQELRRDIYLSFIAHALVCGPKSCVECCGTDFAQHPGHYPFSFYSLLDDPVAFSDGQLRWCATRDEMIPMDPWLCSLLKAKSCLVYGALADGGLRRLTLDDESHSYSLPERARATLVQRAEAADCFLTIWEAQLYHTTPRSILDTLASEGITAIGELMDCSELIVSIDHKGLPLGYPDGKHWTRIRGRLGSRRRWFKAETGNPRKGVPLRSTLASIERTMQHLPESHFVANITMRRKEHSPQSEFARLWNECLGNRAIPFDEDGRKDLIGKACSNPDLKRHIEVWQELSLPWHPGQDLRRLKFARPATPET